MAEGASKMHPRWWQWLLLDLILVAGLYLSAVAVMHTRFPRAALGYSRRPLCLGCSDNAGGLRARGLADQTYPAHIIPAAPDSCESRQELRLPYS